MKSKCAFYKVVIGVIKYISGLTKNPLGSSTDLRNSTVTNQEINYVLVTGNSPESQQMEVFDDNGQTRVCNLKSK